MYKMCGLSPQVYADWRVEFRTEPCLQEPNAAPAPPERLLQAIWQHQRLQREQLVTLDGRPVRILHPGFSNREAGPDFRRAVIQFEAGPPQTGDVEIDLQPAHWHAHCHHQNPAYQNVLLHVVWEPGGKSRSAVPTLALQSNLDSPLAELGLWLNSESVQPRPPSLDGQCQPCLRQVPPPVLKELLRQAASVRLQAKAAQYQARARQAGWEQSLWEGLFRALGYKNNVWPMQRLAELLPRLSASRPHGPAGALAWQARLFGVSGLLPAELTRAQPETDHYLRRLWDLWWREQNDFTESMVPRGLWCFSNLRPANHPQRRLALAAHWLAAGNLLARLETWFTADLSIGAQALSLLDILQAPADEFWSWHWTLRSPRRPQPEPLLGAQRATDLAVNVILPWFWMRAQAGKNLALMHIAEQRYFDWPKAEDNAVLRLARQRLLGGARLSWSHGAAEQQGMLQIVRDFCDQSNALCTLCPFPEKVRRVVRKEM